MLMIASCFGVANAQLMVDENGKVGIGIETTDTLKSQFSINGQSSYSTAYILSEKDYGLRVIRRNVSSGSSIYAMQGINYVTDGKLNYGVVGVTNGYAGSGTTIGVFGRAGAAYSGYNFGLLGRLDCSYNGAAILATTSDASRYETIDVQGKYAGYFCGDTRVTGTMTAGAFVTSSDYRLKENVRSLSKSDGCLNKLMDMNVVEFNNKQRQFTGSITTRHFSDSSESLAEGEVMEANALLENNANDTVSHWYDEESPILKNKHYGLVAQELKEIYPDLVVESQDGYLAINYLEIIPLLIRSVQELKAELDATKGDDAPVQKAQARNTDVTNIDAVVTTLYQNTPNPFTESTLIQCDVAEDVVKADLYIYDMNGKQIDTYSITERGATSITIEGHSLEAGMYLYALIADGQVIDTKRMILTK